MEPSILRATVSARSSADAVEAFRANFARAFLQLELDPLDGVPLECDIAIRPLPDLAIGVGECSSIRGRHPASLSDSDDFVLVALAGGDVLHQRRYNDAILAPGEAVLTRAAETNMFQGHGRTRVVNVRFSRQRLESLVVSADDSIHQPIPARSAALRLLFSQCEILANAAYAVDSELMRSTVASSYDLMAMALGNVRDARAHMGGVRTARLNAVKGDMARRFREPITIGEIARQHGISASYLRQLFAASGTSFADHLLGLRLAAAYRALLSPNLVGLGISAIAYDAGFGDLSYFNRAFRRRYGRTPSDVRAEVRPSG